MPDRTQGRPMVALAFDAPSKRRLQPGCLVNASDDHAGIPLRDKDRARAHAIHEISGLAASSLTMCSIASQRLEKPAPCASVVVREAKRRLQFLDCATGVGSDDAVDLADVESPFQQEFLNLAALGA